MAEEGRNKAAASLLDLQPTAILELFRFYPDRINKPSLFLSIHGGAIFDKSIKWQGVKYLPLGVESEGFDMLGDGKLPRPKIRVANVNSIVTNFLQNYQDFKNAKVVRKKVQVKFLDDSNFDGGNPFGIADSKAELLDEEWIMGRKTQESKVFVEFELNSPLDLENFDVNSRGVQAKFCYWQYRGEGCRYQGLPVERDDGMPFLTTDNVPIIPNYTPPEAPDGAVSQVDFFDDESVKWNTHTNYELGNIAMVESPTILLPLYGGGGANESGVPLRTFYVSVAENNSGNHPEKNPSFWQKDGCTKKLGACQKRFNSADDLIFRGAGDTEKTLPTVRFSGTSMGNVDYIENSGLFHTTEADVTGALDPRKEWTLVGWVNMNQNSPRGAGIFSTSQADNNYWPAARYLNIGRDATWGGGSRTNNVIAQYVGYKVTATRGGSNAWRTHFLNETATPSNAINANEPPPQPWTQYVIRHRTGTANFINGEGDDEDTIIEFFVNGGKTTNNDQFSARGARTDINQLRDNLGNFASWNDRTGIDWGGPDQTDTQKLLPYTFMLGGVEFFRSSDSYDKTPQGPAHVSTMNGELGMWGLWNRALKEQEIRFLRKRIVPPIEVTTNPTPYVPRLYTECVGAMSTLTGGTGWSDPAGTVVPEGTPPILYGKDSLVAWWDGTTGDSSIGNGLLDIHTGLNTTLTGSGNFSGVSHTYRDATTSSLSNPTPSQPRFGGFPGTDGFSYGGKI
jgi:lambda family phage minor tail protein L